MKCPSCGAEIGNSRSCEYCGSRITAAMQKENEQLNKAGCPRCGSTNIQIRRENQGEIRGKNSKTVLNQTVAVCNDCGNTWYPNGKEKPRKTWLWVLGWIFIFPLPLTLILLKKKDMKPILKYGIIAAAWIVYLIIGFSGGTSDNTTTPYNTANENSTSTTTQNSAEFNGNEAIDTFADSMGKKLGKGISFVENFEVQDKTNSHYRVEFRLGAYKDAVGKAYTYNNAKIDIIARKTISNDSVIRVYAICDTIEECNEIVSASANLFDPELSENDIKEITNYMSENKEANGYYKGGLGILLQSNGSDSYSIMLKQGND